MFAHVCTGLDHIVLCYAMLCHVVPSKMREQPPAALCPVPHLARNEHPSIWPRSDSVFAAMAPWPQAISQISMKFDLHESNQFSVDLSCTSVLVSVDR